MTIAAEPRTSEQARTAAVTISVSTLAWAAAVLIFLLLRLGPVWRAPVYGAELTHLSGAWQARSAITDSRFVPTLFQAIAALTLHWTTSPVPARVLAFLATATIPGAIYLLRPRLGEAGALLALSLLAVDAAGIAFSSQASAMGFDLALTVWLFVFMTRGAPWRWTWPVAAFLIALSGPLTLPLLFGWAAVRLWQREYPTLREAAMVAVPAVAGVVLTSFRFGLGWDSLVVAPIRLFVGGYSQDWSSATVSDAILVYSWPLLAAAAVPLLLRASDRRPIRSLDRHNLLLGAWAVAALLWAVSSSQSHTIVPLVALTTPVCIFLGPVLAAGISAMVRAEWISARFLLPAAAFLGLLAIAIAIDWAHLGSATISDRLFLFLLLALMVAGIATAAALEPARPALLAFGAVALLPLFAGTFNVALSAKDAPILSPYSPKQARELRDIALQTASAENGLIVVNSAFSDDVTWPFRDSGTLVVSTRIPADAVVAIWPKGLPQPDGMNPLEGDWTLVHEVDQPSGSFLQYLRWLIDRHSVAASPVDVAVYVRAQQ